MNSYELPVIGDPKLDRMVVQLKELTKDERLEIFSYFCKYCGGDDPRCYCCRDE